MGVQRPLWDELRQIRLYASKLGRITRYVADLRKPEWHAYMRRRIDLALDAGADGVMLDNNFNPEPPAKVDDKNYLLDTYVEMYQYGSSRKRDFLLMGNFHPKTYVYNRVLNSFTTEDGEEPGIYAGRESVGTYPLEGGLLVNNIGVFRIHQHFRKAGNRRWWKMYAVALMGYVNMLPYLPRGTNWHSPSP